MFHHLSAQGQLFDSNGRWLLDVPTDALDVPEGVRLVISRRLDVLSDRCRRLLAVAAVIGRRSDLGLLEAYEDADNETLLDTSNLLLPAHGKLQHACLCR